MDANKFLNISEIFYSIQGEGTRAGLPCVFIRLQGCNFRCSWCDTPYALDTSHQESLLSFQQIIDSVLKFNCNFIEFTGGEPLLQPSVIDLINFFANSGYIVAIETNGTQSFANIDPKVVKIMDIKCPSSKMFRFNNFENFNFLNKNDELKFVVQDFDDFQYALRIISEYSLDNIVDNILFSPVFGLCEPKDLANWILSAHKSFRLQLQLHKFIWHPNTRGV